MPKLKQTEQQKREKAITHAISRGRIEKDIRSERELVDLLGMTAGNYGYHKRNGFQRMSFGDFCRMARFLDFSAQEICSIVGIPYKEEAS